MTFRFAHPQYLLLLAPLALAAWRMYARRVSAGIQFSRAAELLPVCRTWRTALAAAVPPLYLAGLALAIVALARPQGVSEAVAQRSDAIAIMMAVDCSGSMEALDFAGESRRVTRLDVVKDTFEKFVEKRPDDLIGLVSFGGYATARVPLTLDHGAVRHALKGVQIPRPTLDANGQVANEEELLTAIGDGLATACARLEKANVKSKIIVLLSDGESNTGVIKPEEAVKVAKALGIKVYTIGVGSNGLAPFIFRNAFGREEIRRVQVSMDEELLRGIAAATGGKYFNVRDARGMRLALDDIDKLEKTRVRRLVYSRYSEYFALLLGPGLALIALALGLNTAACGRLV